MRKFVNVCKGGLRSVLASAVALVALSGIVLAQVPSSIGPYNSDFGVVITNSARPNSATPVVSAQLSNTSYGGVVCTFNQASASGSPSTVFGIQIFDSASNSYQTLVSSGAITGTTTPTSVVVYPGVQTSSLPAGMVAISMHLPRFWRVTQTVSTSNTTTTGTIGCGYLK